MESVICPIIIFLNEPEMEMYPRTKITPMAINDTVNNVLLLYRKRFRIAIFKRLPILLSPFHLLIYQFSIGQRINDLRFAHNLLVMGGENKSSLPLVAHLFHELDDGIGSLRVQVRLR